MVADAGQGDGPLNLCHWELSQALQHADVLPNPGPASVLLLQVLPQLPEDGRQLPAAKDMGMIERCRFAAEAGQVVDGLQDLLALAIGTWMAGDGLAIGHDLDVCDVSLDRHLAKGVGAGHAVVVVVQADRLILVHLGWVHKARIEGTPWK
jgi:hypothetical protein